MIQSENYQWAGVLEFLHVKLVLFRNNIRINH